MLNPTPANQDLIPNLTTVSASPHNVTCNQSIWNYLVSTGELIHQVDFAVPQQKVTLPKTVPSLLFAFLCLLLMKVFRFAQLFSIPFYLLGEMLVDP